VVERLLTPRIALTVAENLAFVDGRHVLVVMGDMTSYAEALREVSSGRGEIPARRAYPGYLYSDLASLYERCGRVRGLAGSVYPPVDLLGSLSRLMRTGAGAGRTREDHLDVAAQGLAALARAQQARELADLVGEEALSETDRRYVAFATALQRDVVNQSPSENRSMDETLDRLWAALAMLPVRELTMVSAQQREAYLPQRGDLTRSST
jgi:V/A-type H+-transporting ATPase subunit B